MSETLAILYLIGTVITLVVFVVFFAKRYPRQPGWLAIGVAVGIAMMFLWPVTMWIAIAMGLTGFTRPRTAGAPNYQKPPLLFPKKVVIPLCVAGALITIGVIRATTGPVVEPESAVATAPGTTPAPSVGNTPAPPPTITVVDVVDGDTIKLNDGRTVRIIGIDTPETVALGKPVECGGAEATAFARQELLGRAVTLIGDPTQNLLDHYGRTLT